MFTDVKPDTLKRILRDNVRRRREELGISQNKLAGMLDVDQTTIQKFEAGKHSISIELLAKLAEVLDVSADSLLAIRRTARKAAAV